MIYHRGTDTTEPNNHTISIMQGRHSLKEFFDFAKGHVAWRPLLGLLNWYPLIFVKTLQFTWRSRTRQPWWRHQIETFPASLAVCAENSPVPGEFLAQRPVTRSFDVFFDLHPNKRLSKQWRGWWFETPLCPLWRHRNGNGKRSLKWVAVTWLNDRGPG